ncbi:MAG: NAD(P)H-hydrate dehydratase [Bacteroidetes bacterium]|nr:NAD(P)H-hydrate dehydratase [Bacteroidota bacterium]MCW5897025.1 NAD(P)H-hydrate dehydratase [Bacteroidota bacterium]
MQLLATAEQMQQCDRSAIMKYSLPGIVLMENAGRACVDVLLQEVEARNLTPPENHWIVVLCGKGNNGGDGFVIARHLANRGYKVHVVLLAKRREVKGDAKTNLDVLLKMVTSNWMPLTFVEVSKAQQLLRLPSSSVIVDAIFGTGFAGEVKGLYRAAIKWINSQRAFIASVDIPSGVNATSGVVEGIAVRADLTVTMGLAKIGHYVGAGRDHSGMVRIVDISIPEFIFRQAEISTHRVELSDVRGSLPQRPLTAHKYSVGKVLVVAGSRNLTGAPFMTATAAMNTGAGGVMLAIPKSIHLTLARKSTEVMFTPLAETEEGTISMQAIEGLNKQIQWADVVALGPGLSQNPETRTLVHHLVRNIDKPLILDADGIGMMAYDISLLKKRKYETILTPHVGELRLLTKLSGEDIEQQRVDVARTQAKGLNSIVVLKGSPTVTAIRDGSVFLNSTGNPGMATAGSGDVLTGIIASLRAQGANADIAAYAGVYLHGLAGDRAAAKFGARSIMAMDILDCIPEALRLIETA